jgi:hypothetical protein
MAARISIYYVALAAFVAVAVTVFPSIVDQLPLGGVGDISDYGSSSVYDLEEALLSADDEELEEIATATTRARLAKGPVWLQDGRYFVVNAAGLLGLQSHPYGQRLRSLD